MEAAGGGDAPGHGGGVVGEAEAAVGAEEDDAAVSAEAVVEVGDGFAGGDFGGGAGGDAIGGPLAEDQFHDGFAPAGEGDGGGEIVGVAAATDERRVADAAGCFVEGASGGGGGGEIAAGIEGDGADGVVAVWSGRRGFVVPRSPNASGPGAPDVVGSKLKGGFGILVVAVAGEGGIGEAGGVTGLCLGEAFAFAIEDELAVVDEVHAVGRSEVFGAFADEVDMGALFEDEARGVDGIAEALDAGDAAGFHATAVHEEGVELDATVGGEEAATAGVEGGIVFEDGDGGFDGVDGCAAASEDFVTDFKGAADAGFVSGCGVGGDGPCSAVDEEGRVVGGGLGHYSDMVVHWRRARSIAMKRLSRMPVV